MKIVFIKMVGSTTLFPSHVDKERLLSRLAGSYTQREVAKYLNMFPLLVQ